MKKKILIAIVVLSVFVLGTALGLNSIFPYARPISVPPVERICAIHISSNEGGEAAVLHKDFEKIMSTICDARPTRTMSVNDYPTARPYYSIEVLSGKKTTRYFVYEEQGNVYLEIPYEGIYFTDEQMLEMVNAWLS